LAKAEQKRSEQHGILRKLRRCTDNFNRLLRRLWEASRGTGPGKHHTAIHSAPWRNGCGLDCGCVATRAGSIRSFDRGLVACAESTAAKCQLDSDAVGAASGFAAIKPGLGFSRCGRAYCQLESRRLTIGSGRCSRDGSGGRHRPHF